MRTFITSLLIGLVAIVPIHGAVGQPVDGGRATVEVVSERDAVVPGESFFAAFDMVMDDGWHVYWRNPGDAGLPPVAHWDGDGAALVGDFVWPVPHELPVVPGQIMDYGYDHRLVLPFQVTVPTDAVGLISLSGRLDYLICEEICIPESVDFRFTLPISDEAKIDQESGALIADWIAAAPQPFEGDACLSERDDKLILSLADDALSRHRGSARYFPFENEIVHASPQSVEYGAEGLSLSLDPSPDLPVPDTIAGVLLLEQQSGIRTGYEFQATQCPVLAGTTGQTVVGGSGATSINLVAIAMLALFGGLVLNLMPCVLPVLSIKAAGLVEAAAHGDGVTIRRHGIWYTGGVVLSFLAIAALFVGLRSAGAFLSIGFQLQYPVMVSLLALLMFAIGLWLLGLFELGTSIQGAGSTLAEKSGSAGAFFTGVLVAVVGAPCIGPFLGVALGSVINQPAAIVFLVFGLVGFGLALPFLMLSFVPGLQSRLPKPGAWMERIKQFFAFPMFLTAAWLLSVLGDQAGPGPVAWTVAAAVVLGFAIWVISKPSPGWGARIVFVLLLIAGIALPVQAALRADGSQRASNVTYAEDYPSEIWTRSKVDEALAGGKGVFVDFTASWCATCQLNKATTLRRTSVQRAFAENDIVFMVADFTNGDEEIADELRLRRRPGVPMYLLFAPGASEPKILPQILSERLILDELALLSDQ